MLININLGGKLKIFSLIIIVLLFMLSSNLYSQPNNNFKTDFTYLSPVPNSQMNSPFTNIVIRSKNNLKDKIINSNDVVVTGSKSGVHTGKAIILDDDGTFIFKPYLKFEDGETVNVNINSGMNQITDKPVYTFSFKFSISKKNLNTRKRSEYYVKKEIEKVIRNENSYYDYSSEKMLKINGDSLGLPHDFPQLYISVLSNPSPGYTFLSNFNAAAFNPSAGTQTHLYLMILDNSGKPFYYKKMTNFCLDFKVQPNGQITYFDSKVGYFYELNNNLEVVDSFYCGNGYWPDFHDLQILPNGHALMIGYDDEKVDMSKIVSGGDTNATVYGKVIQELDENKNVIFQWRSFDHYKITDATYDINLLDTAIDYAHTNAIELDNDGNILISNRHMDEITKIDRATGDIIWRLGGKNNEFNFMNDSIGFSHQHDIRRISNGDITLFDNGNLHWSQMATRVLEYKLDEINKIAELVWQFRNTPDEITNAMGNIQRLEDGNSIIGWGSGRPSVTEITPNGLKEFELSLPENEFSYRAFRFMLDSSYYKLFIPSLEAPENNTLIPDTAITLHWSKNKFAQSFHLQLSSDSSFMDVLKIDSVLTYTSLTIDSLEDGRKYYWRVLSFNNTDSVGGFSGYAQAHKFATLLKRPLNTSILASQNRNLLSWTNISSNADSIIIERKGGSDSVNYKFIAEISSDKNNFIDTYPDTVNVITNKYIYRIKAANRYSRSAYSYFPEVIWNITSVNTAKNNLPTEYALVQNYPNPFNPSTTIEYAIPERTNVTIKVFDILGREVAKLVNEEKPAGNYRVNFNGSNLSNGIYLYRMEAGKFNETKKLILLK